MSALWTSFLLGLVGSLHCAVMCGPLLMALNSANGCRGGQLNAWLYHCGRLTTYAVIGLVCGLVGKTISAFGAQRWICLGLGLTVLAMLFCSNRLPGGGRFAASMLRFKALFSRAIKLNTPGGRFLLGALNGFLPCGLVYVAAAGAASSFSAGLGMLHMVLFGIGTLPMLASLAVIAGKLSFVRRQGNRILTVTIAAAGVLLVFRGLALGIPHLSPAIPVGANAISCH